MRRRSELMSMIDGWCTLTDEMIRVCTAKTGFKSIVEYKLQERRLLKQPQ